MIVGRHVIVELEGCAFKVINNPMKLRVAIRQAVKEAGATLLHLHHEMFQPHGVTCMAVLAESHISIHTWPEHGYAAIDVFTCGRTQPEKAAEYLAKALEAVHIRTKIVQRGMTDIPVMEQGRAML